MTLRRLAPLFFVGLIAGLFEATTATFLPAPWSWIHPLLPLIVSSVIFERPTDAVIVALTGGLTLDLFSGGTSAFAFARLFLIVQVMTLIARHLLTNRSIVSAVALAVLARLLEWIWLLVVGWIPPLVHGVSIAQPWNIEWRIMLWDAFFVIAVFYGSVFLFKRLVGLRVWRT